MRFKNLILATFLFLGIILLSSCKEDAFKSDKELLTTGSWKITSVIYEPPLELSDGTLVTDVHELETECALDNTLTFTEEDTYYLSEGTVQCAWNDQVYQTGDWRFVTENGEKSIDYDPEKDLPVRYYYKIKSITKDELVLLFKTISGNVHTMTYDNTAY